MRYFYFLKEIILAIRQRKKLVPKTAKERPQ
jgi:hypothetical protein